MWKNDVIQVYFSLFGAPSAVLDLVKERGITQEDMDEMTIKALLELGITSKSVCNMMLLEWKKINSIGNPVTALNAIEKAMV
jgi:hypothetical protein